MKPHIWTELKGPRPLIIFGCAVIAVILFWTFLVPGGFGRMLMTRRGPTALLIWHAGWFGGWFTLLFVRVQDLHLMTDYNYEAVRKLVGWLMIIGSALFFLFVYAAVHASSP